MRVHRLIAATLLVLGLHVLAGTAYAQRMTPAEALDHPSAAPRALKNTRDVASLQVMAAVADVRNAVEGVLIGEGLAIDSTNSTETHLYTTLVPTCQGSMMRDGTCNGFLYRGTRVMVELSGSDSGTTLTVALTEQQRSMNRRANWSDPTVKRNETRELLDKFKAALVSPASR